MSVEAPDRITAARDREGRRYYILGLTAILSAAVVAVLLTAGIIVQHLHYTDQFTQRQKACVSAGSTWSQNVGGDWECRH